MPHSAANRPQGYQPQITCAQARTQLAMLLLNTTEEKLAGFTAEGLARMYRVKAAEIGTMLEAERERRRENQRRRQSLHGGADG